MSNVLIDFTEELFSELRIPLHEVSLPLKWDDRFDLGLRKTLTGESDSLLQKNFLDFDPLFKGKKTLFLVKTCSPAIIFCSPWSRKGSCWQGLFFLKFLQ